MTETSIGRWTRAGIFKGALAGAAAGLLGNLALYFIAGAAGVAMTARFRPDQPVQPLLLVAVVISSLVTALPAGIVAMVVGRVSASPAKVYAIIATLFAVVSMGGPLNLAEASVGLKVVLAIMHVFSGAGITLGVLRSAPAK
jgi:hypothetical protein